MRTLVAPNHSTLIVAICALLLSACTMQPLATTVDIARTQKIAVGQLRTDVEATMARKGRVLSYPLKPGETTQIWRVEDHFVSRCFFVTYDKSDRVTEIALIERERDERGKLGGMFSGSC
jgi:hypothetical protein